jgi:hypothetical protein
MQELGKYLLIVGGIMLLLGLILYFGGNKFSWFGNLPGDIKIKKENFVFYMPIGSMLLLSLLLSLLWWIIRRFL